jgi:hypothetical protein
MALAITYNPQLRYLSAHEDIIFTLLEDTKPFNSTAYPDYKYVCDIYIVDANAVETLAVRLKSFPRPSSKIGVFEIGSVIRNYLAAAFQPQPTDIFYQKLSVDNFFVQVICRFGEEYGFTTYPNIIVDSQRAYFNHYNGRQFGTTTILQTYLDKVLSDRPYATTITRSSKHNLIPFLASDDTVINVEVRCYNKSVGLVRQQDFTVTPTASSIDEIEQINVAPECLNYAFPGLIDDYIDYYTVTWNTTNIVNDSVYRFDLICERKYETHSLHFLNKLGGFESKEFTKVSKKTKESRRSTYKKSSYTVNPDGTVTFFDSATKAYQEQSSTYAVEFEEKMQLNTDILTDEEYVWLEQLVFSPIVFCKINDYFFPITITDNNYELKKRINGGLTNLTLNIEFGETFNTQYR